MAGLTMRTANLHHLDVERRHLRNLCKNSSVTPAQAGIRFSATVRVVDVPVSMSPGVRRDDEKNGVPVDFRRGLAFTGVVAVTGSAWMDRPLTSPASSLSAASCPRHARIHWPASTPSIVLAASLPSGHASTFRTLNIRASTFDRLNVRALRIGLNIRGLRRKRLINWVFVGSMRHHNIDAKTAASLNFLNIRA
jgi:hypothetical protein